MQDLVLGSVMPLANDRNGKERDGGQDVIHQYGSLDAKDPHLKSRIRERLRDYRSPDRYRVRRGHRVHMSGRRRKNDGDLLAATRHLTHADKIGAVVVSRLFEAGDQFSPFYGHRSLPDLAVGAFGYASCKMEA